MMRLLERQIELGRVLVIQDPIVVGIRPDSPYISRNYIWRYRRFHGWRIVKMVYHAHADGQHGICPPRHGWLGVLLGWHA